jgi:hypothetical protein
MTKRLAKIGCIFLVLLTTFGATYTQHMNYWYAGWAIFWSAILASVVTFWIMYDAW